MIQRAAALALALASLPGCISLGKPAPPVREYVIDYETPAVQHERLPVVLRVSPLTIASAYAGPGIAYRVGDARMGRYPFDRWATEASTMIADLLTRDLVSSGAYEAVIHGPSLQSSDYDLSGEVEELGEKDAPGCVARVRFRLLLRRRSRERAERAVLFQRPYEEDEPCTANNAAQVVAALGRATQRLSTRVQEDVYAAIAGDAPRATGEQRSVPAR